jgi:hypothetical protein
MFPMHIRTAWDYYFPFYNSETFTSRQSFTETSVTVSNCLFRSISSSSSHGGALYCTSAFYFIVKSSSFFSCRTSSGYGGAIYFSNTNNGQSILYEVCGYDCFTTYTNPYYQFAYIQVNYAASRKNYFNYSSISRCVNTNSNSWYTLYLYGGNVFCPSVNFSLNKCYYQTIYFNPYSDSNSVTCSFSFSSFADNTITQYTCICFASGGAKYEIKSCNILRNTQSSSSQGIIATWGNTNIEYSCILENNAYYIFYQGNSNYRITLSNCTADGTSNNGYLTIQKTVTKSFILALNHMSTQHCYSEYDSAGTITHIMPLSSSLKKQMLRYSCNEFFSQFSLRDFFLLTSISSALKLLPQ